MKIFLAGLALGVVIGTASFALTAFANETIAVASAG